MKVYIKHNKEFEGLVICLFFSFCKLFFFHKTENSISCHYMEDKGMCMHTGIKPFKLSYLHSLEFPGLYMKSGDGEFHTLASVVKLGRNLMRLVLAKQMDF